jgi:hypothetical protein
MKLFCSSRYTDPAMLDAIAVYENHIAGQTIPDASQLKASPFLSYIHLVHLIHQKEAKLKKASQWSEFKVSVEALFSNALQREESARSLRSSALLLKAWVYAKIAKLDPDNNEHSIKSDELFENAKKAENKKNIENPISGGKVHHISAMLQWAQVDPEEVDLSEQFEELADDWLIAVEKGFSYTAYAFSQPMIELTQAIMKQDKIKSNRLASIESLSDFTLTDLISDEVIFDRQLQSNSAFLMEFQSATMARYCYAIQLMAIGKHDLALEQLKKVLTLGEHAVITQTHENDDKDVKNIKEFWSALLLRDYSALRAQFYNALVSYNRSAEDKQGRQDIRNEILKRFIQIDSRGSETEDKLKLDDIKQQILPLIIRLSGTTLSADQKRGIQGAVSKVVPSKVGTIALQKSMSDLAMNLLSILIHTVGLSINDVASIEDRHIEQLKIAGHFDLTLARKACEKYVKDTLNRLNQSYSEYPLYTICRKIYDQSIGTSVKTQRHGLIFLAQLELLLSTNSTASVANEVGKIYQQFCELDSRAYDPLIIMTRIGKQVSSSDKLSVFDRLRQTGTTDNNTSFLNFSHHSSYSINYTKQDREGLISYIIALELLAKNRIELGVYYLANAFTLGKRGEIFYQIDNGFVAGLFDQRNWQVFSVLFKCAMHDYVQQHQDQKDSKKGRADYVVQILRELQSIIDNKELNNSARIQRCKETILPMLLFLSGFNLGKAQRLALSKDFLKTKNLNKASKRGLNMMVQLLGVTLDDFGYAKNRCMSKHTDSLEDMRFGMHACEKYVSELLNSLQQNAVSTKRILEHRCLPFLATAVGQFTWVANAPSEQAMRQFVGRQIVTSKTVSSQSASSSASLQELSDSEDESEIFQPLPLNMDTVGALSNRTEPFSAQFGQLLAVLPPPLPPLPPMSNACLLEVESTDVTLPPPLHTTAPVSQATLFSMRSNAQLSVNKVDEPENIAASSTQFGK